MHKYLVCLLIGTSGALSLPARAQDAAGDDAQSAEVVIADYRIAETAITVTATGTRIEVEDTGQPVSVIGRSEIEAVQGADLTRVLTRVPGVSFSRNGAPGSFTGLRVRGAAAEQLLVVVDGVRVADPAAPGGGFDFGNLTAGNVEKLDLLRSSNSTVWGSDAIGGVLAVGTRGQSGFEASAEYGARDTAFATASGGVGGEHGFLGGSAAWYRTDGFSSAAQGTEPDGFEQWAANGQGRLYVSPRFEVFVRGRYAKGELDLDGYPAPSYALADTAESQRTRQFSGAAGAVYDSGALFLSAAYSLADTARSTFDPAQGPAPTFTSDGRSSRFDLTGEWRPIGPLLVNFGGDYQRTRFETLFDAPARSHSAGAYAQLGIEYGPLAAHAGARRDDHARFGGTTSFGADLSYAIAPGLRLRASLGEGFKAPTLFQLLSDYGNAALDPERSTSFDLALAWHDRNAMPYAALSLFRRDSEDLIDFVSCFGTASGICTGRPYGTYDNIGRVRAQGVELEAGAELAPGFAARIAYSYAVTDNRTPGSPDRGHSLARRPRHALSAGGEWQPADRGPALGADLRWVSGSFDDAANLVRLAPYAVLDLSARWPLDDKVELFGRVENLWDERYQTAAGYASSGRGVFFGARLRL